MKSLAVRCLVAGTLTLVLGPAAVAGQVKPPTPAEQYQALLKEFYGAAHLFSFKARNDEEKNEAVARVARLRLQALELAEKHPGDPVAPDALVQAASQEMWLESNTSYPGDGKDSTARAIALLLRDHLHSEKLGEACRRLAYGFRKECETFLRTVLEKSPHRDVRAQACLRLPQFLNARLQRLDLLAEQPEMARRYEALFGKDYLAALRGQDRARAMAEVEALFERAAREYGDVKVPYGGTVAEKAKSELHEIRHLAVGKVAQDIEGEDQDGKRFKLSDYRGKVVLLYFWSEY
jgi:hypothetical protein